MIPAVSLFVSILLFLAGLRLSFFFSGCETGFYRVSPLQLSIRAQQGDRIAAQLQRFIERPERFVATSLVGNNIAHYLITVAIGLFMSVLVYNSSGTAEVVSTVIVTPLVFVFGELIPKSLACLAPMSRLRAEARWFVVACAACAPLSYPLTLLARMIAHLGSSDREPLELVLSRTRLVSVLEEGHREGLLTALQSQLAENVIQVARHPVMLSMIPAMSVLGASESASRDELLRFARRLQSAVILLHPHGLPGSWSAVVRVADIIRSDQSPRSVATSLPRFDALTSKLTALSELIRCRSAYGVVAEEGRVIGVVSRRTLLADLQRTGPRTHEAVESAASQAAVSSHTAAVAERIAGTLRQTSPTSGQPERTRPPETPSN